MFDPDEIMSWLNEHGKEPFPPDEDSGLVPNELRHHPMVKLLGKACRNRSYWISEEGNSHFDGFVKDPHWHVIYKLLKEHELVRVEYRQVSGRNNVFFHIKKGSDILGEQADNDIRAFYASLVAEMRKDT